VLGGNERLKIDERKEASELLDGLLMWMVRLLYTLRDVRFSGVKGALFLLVIASN
jgi:hypothetical protein